MNSQVVAINKANEKRRQQDVIAKLTRERDALQQQNYDLAAKVAHIEKERQRESDEAVEIIHDLQGKLDSLRARMNG